VTKQAEGLSLPACPLHLLTRGVGAQFPDTHRETAEDPKG